MNSRCYLNEAIQICRFLRAQQEIDLFRDFFQNFPGDQFLALGSRLVIVVNGD